MSRLLLLLVLATVVFPLTACDSSDGSDDTNTVTGAWRGDFTQDGTAYAIILDLQQSGNPDSPTGATVTGSGEALEEDATIGTFDVNATLSGNVISGSLQVPDSRPGNINGTVAGDYMTMTVTITTGGLNVTAEDVVFEKR